MINQRYQVVRQVGQGGMGAVYEAIDTRLGHHVALKQTLITDPQYVHAFEREARLLAHLKHAHLPRVTDHFSDADGQFLVMDFVLGEDLAALFQQHGGPFPLAQVLSWADQLLDALTYLHGQQPPVLHRDIKPQNLKQTPDGTLILLDFGLAKGALWQTRLTGSGSIAGYTPAYAPLEQIQSTGTDIRSDLYAVGATLYHLLVGTPPPNALTRAASLLSQEPDPLRPPHERNPAIPQTVSAALVQAMSTNPNARPESAAALQTMLRAMPQVIRQPGSAQQPFAVGTPTIAISPPHGAPTPAPPKVGKPPLLWIGVLVVVLLGAGALIWGGGKGAQTPAYESPVSTSMPPRTAQPAALPAAETPSAIVAPSVIPSATAVPTTAPAILTEALVPEMIEIPTITFLMGSSPTDPQAQSNEQPQHQLTLSTYWIGKTEVTNAQFRPFVEGDGYTNPDYWTAAGWAWQQAENITQPKYWNDLNWNGAAYPVVGVSWFEAVAYCRWLSKQTGVEFRLPSEAEWEQAARGPDALIWPWGTTWENGRANSKDAQIKQTTPVGQYHEGASHYGALDMAGNVWEWCATQAGKPYPYQIEDEWRPAYLERDTDRVLRGGSMYDGQGLMRGAFRLNHDLSPRNRLNDIGLRVTWTGE